MHCISLYRLKTFVYIQIYMSKTLLRILALPSRQTFCSSSMSQVMFSTLSHFGRHLGSVPRAPIITGIILTSEYFQILCSSLLKSWYFSIFSFSLLATLVSNGHAMSVSRHFLLVFSRTTISGLLASIGRSVGMEKSHL